MEPLSVPRTVPAGHTGPRCETRGLCRELGAVCAAEKGCGEGSGGAAWGPGFITHSCWPQNTTGLPTHLAAHLSQSFPQADWNLHEGLFPGY